jgi:hypothetical protein
MMTFKDVYVSEAENIIQSLRQRFPKKVCSIQKHLSAAVDNNDDDKDDDDDEDDDDDDDDDADDDDDEEEEEEEEEEGDDCRVCAHEVSGKTLKNHALRTNFCNFFESITPYSHLNKVAKFEAKFAAVVNNFT